MVSAQGLWRAISVHSCRATTRPMYCLPKCDRTDAHLSKNIDERAYFVRDILLVTFRRISSRLHLRCCMFGIMRVASGRRRSCVDSLGLCAGILTTGRGSHRSLASLFCFRHLLDRRACESHALK